MGTYFGKRAVMHICSVCKAQVPTAKGLKIHFGHRHKNKTANTGIQPPPLPPDQVPPNLSNRPSQVNSSNAPSNRPSSPPTVTSFVCLVCSQVFGTKRGLQTHRSSHPVEANIARLAKQHQPRNAPVNESNFDDNHSTDLVSDCNAWTQKFTAILNNIDNFDSDLFDKTMTDFGKFLFSANEHLPGPVHPATRMYRLRKQGTNKNSGAQYSRSSNPQRTDTKARERRREKYQYELAQWQYNNQRRKVVQNVMDPKSANMKRCQIPIEQVEKHFTTILTEPNDCTLDYYPVKVQQEDITVTTDEVQRAIMSIKIDTSSGYDRVLARTIRELKLSTTIKVIIDIMLITGTVPSNLKLGKTILIHKGGDENDIANFRPITIYSIIRRIIEKVLDRHLRSQINLNCNQRGFVTGLPGCHINSILMNAVLQKAKNTQSDCTLMFLDISKAFDRIGHAHIGKCLEAQGVSKNLQNLINALLKNNTVRIDLGNKRTNSIQIKRSVPQGGPLSPILFNLGIDFIYQEICEPDYANYHGYQLCNNLDSLSLTGFADDQVITSNSVEGATRIADQAQFMFKSIGLEINANKSTAIVIKSGKLIPGQVNLCNGSVINCIGEQDRIKYLGCNFQSKLIFDNAIVGHLTQQMNNLIISPLLRNDQKLNILNQYLLPALTYPLQSAPLPEIPKLDLDTLDLNIRSTVKAIIGLPTATSTDMIYAPRKFRGLGIVRCGWEVYLQHYAIASKLSHISDAMLHQVFNSSGEMELCKRTLRVDGDSAKQLRMALRDKSFNDWASNSYQGVGIKHYRIYSKANSFMYNKQSLSSSDWTAALKLNTNYANLKGVPGVAQGHGQNRRCRRCHNENNRETPSHVLGCCPFGENRRNARHHEVQLRLIAMLQDKGFDCYDEVTCIDDNGTNRRVDILAFDLKSNKAYVIDPTVRFENNEDMDEVVQLEKAGIYDKCFNDLKERYKQYGERQLETIGLWFGSRGTIGKNVVNFFERFQLDKKKLPEIAESILAASIRMIHAHSYT